MSRGDILRRRPATWQLIIVLSCGVALVRSLAPVEAAHPSGLTTPELPTELAGQAGREVSLSPSEALLDAAPGAHLTRRTYGASAAALVTTTGFKELHPPEVCLLASGYEVAERREEQSDQGCLGHMHLRARDEGTLTHFFYTYTDGETVTCSFWRRAGLAAWDLLTGRRTAWSSVQVMNADPAQARSTLIALLQHRASWSNFASPRRTR